MSRLKRLEEWQHDEIVEKYEDGEATVDLAEEYGITPQAVYALLKRRGVKTKNRRKKHGSDAGYQRHMRNGKEPCERCMAAHLTKNNRLRRKPGAQQRYYETQNMKDRAKREAEQAQRVREVDAERVILALRHDRRIVE